MQVAKTGAATLSLLVFCSACGSRTELEDLESSDASADAPIADAMRDARPIDSPPPPPPGDAATCCHDEQNTQYALDENSGGASCAWEYVPQCNIDVKRIELHNFGGYIAIHADDSGRPGAVLFEGTMPTLTSFSWIGIDISPAVPLVAGRRYWIHEAAGPLSSAAQGTQYTYWCETNGWSGPFNWHAWTSKIYGSCK